MYIDICVYVHIYICLYICRERDAFDLLGPPYSVGREGAAADAGRGSGHVGERREPAPASGSEIAGVALQQSMARSVSGGLASGAEAIPWLDGHRARSPTHEPN